MTACSEDLSLATTSTKGLCDQQDIIVPRSRRAQRGSGDRATSHMAHGDLHVGFSLLCGNLELVE
jgi:hypothetical protein